MTQNRHSREPARPAAAISNLQSPISDIQSPTSPTFIQLYDTLATTGLLARLSASAFKVLAALGLAATPLGSGTAANRAFFRDLVRRGTVTPADRGRLFCCLRHHELARRAGLGKNTVSRATAELHALGLIEKRTIPKPDGTRYNLFFLLPASQIDKFNVHRAQLPQPSTLGPSTLGPQYPISNTQSPLPKTGTASEVKPLPKTGTVPKTGTNYIQKTTTTTTTTPRVEIDNNLDFPALLSYFARRQGVARYRPTAHDRHKLDLLRRRGCSQEQILAAIDHAFDRRPADAPPIRMFAYCAAIALAGRLVGPPPAGAETPATAGTPAAVEAPSLRGPSFGPKQSPIATRGLLHRSQTALARNDGEVGDCATAACGPVSGLGNDREDKATAATAEPPLPPLLATLYETEIGPLSPLARRQLAALVAEHPDPAAWDYAFGQAVEANVRNLRYVKAVLQAHARRSAGKPPDRVGAGLAPAQQADRKGAPLHVEMIADTGGKDGRRQEAGRTEFGRRAPGRRERPGGRQRSGPRRDVDRGGGGGPACSGSADPEDPHFLFNWHTCTEEELLAIQRAAAAVEPLDYRVVLGVDHA